jgi:GNAT superfamily N-acetyltransferase
MAIENYQLERRSASGLHERASEIFFRKKLGRMAFVDDTPVGFLIFGEKFTINKSGAKGATSPLYGYGIRYSKRGDIIEKLLQSVASELCEYFAQRLSVSVYAHDTDVLWKYLMSGFFLETTGTMRDIFSPIKAEMQGKYSFKELGKKELINYKGEIIELYRGLINHLRGSPIFYHGRNFLPVEKRFDDFLKDDIRIFAVFDGNRLIGMMDAEPVDDGFAKDDIEALDMSDVFIEPAYRGNGIAATLLKYANDELKSSGTRRLFVTHGTINPTANGFWDKYFTNYYYSMTRSIDPEMLGKIKPV